MRCYLYVIKIIFNRKFIETKTHNFCYEIFVLKLDYVLSLFRTEHKKYGTG